MLNNIFSCLIVLLPFLYQYKSPIGVISLGELLLVPFIIYFLINFKWKINLKKFNGLYTYFGIAIFTSIISMLQSHFEINSFITVFIRMIFYGILIFFSYEKIEVEYAFNFLIKLSNFFSIYALIQFIVYKTVGVILPTAINTNWIFGPELGNRLDYSIYYRYSFRPSSLFLEPSYMALFCGPALAYSLFYNKDKNNIFSALIITVGLIVSTSSAGLGVIMLCWGGYIFEFLLFEKNKKVNSKFIGIFLCCTIICIILTSPLAINSLNRFSSGGSFNNRIVRGVLIAPHMNLFQQFVGVGINNLGNFVQKKNIVTIYDEADLNYTASFLGTYICSGIITWIFYITFFIRIFLKNKLVLIRILIVMLLFFSVIEMNSFSYRFAFMVILIFSLQYEFRDKNKI